MLQWLGIGTAAGLAGCSSGESTPTPTESPTPTELGGGDDEETDTPTETPEQAREPSGTYVSGDSTGVTTLNFIQVADAPTSARIGLALDSAYAIKPGPEVFPLWMDVSTDENRVYEFELRDNLQWGAGYGQMTSEDWVYMIQNVFQAEDNWAGFANPGDWTETVDGESQPIPVEKTGKLTFEMRLNEVDPAFPLKPVMWGQYCMPKGLLQPYVEEKDAEGINQDEEVQTLAYSGNLGPYNFDTWERESVFEAARNDDYYMEGVDDVSRSWQNAPYFERYHIQVIPEESTRLSALKEGEITATGIPETKVSQFQGNDDINVNQSPQPFNSLLIYNQRANGNFYEAFRKQSVRRALSWAVDKQSVVDNILRGFADVAHTFQPKFSAWYDDSAVQQTGVGDRYDPDEAQSRLSDALGDTPYTYDGDTVVDENGDPVTLQLLYPTGTQTTKTTVEFIAQEYGNIGLNVEVNGVQFNTLLGQYVQTRTDLEESTATPAYNAGPFNSGPRDRFVSNEPWDLQYGIIFNTFPRTPTSVEGFWTRKGGTNYYGYHPEAPMTELFSQASTATNDADRQEALTEIFGALSEEQPCNFMNFGVSITGYQDEVVGPKEIFANGWDSNTWYFEQE